MPRGQSVIHRNKRTYNKQMNWNLYMQILCNSKLHSLFFFLFSIYRQDPGFNSDLNFVEELIGFLFEKFMK